MFASPQKRWLKFCVTTNMMVTSCIYIYYYYYYYYCYYFYMQPKCYTDGYRVVLLFTTEII